MAGFHPEQRQLASMVAAILEEWTALKAKSADIALKVTACREQVALVRKERESRVEGDKKNVVAGAEEKTVPNQEVRESLSDVVTGHGVNGAVTSWLKLL
jgi:hypothetical protein